MRQTRRPSDWNGLVDYGLQFRRRTPEQLQRARILGSVSHAQPGALRNGACFCGNFLPGRSFTVGACVASQLTKGDIQEVEGTQ